ncbi:MAG: acetoacetate decarboxylase family protein [Lachnospirales bacterium]
MRGSFLASTEDVKNLFKVSQMNNQEGIYVCWSTDPKVVKRILPPPLEMVGPVVFAYIINIQEATFCSRYTEGAMAIPATYNGVQGLYWTSFMLGGPGAQMGTFAGREVGGIPKKIADEIRVERSGNYAHAYVERHGIRIIDVELDITGKYNNIAAKGVFGEPVKDLEVLLNGFFYKYDVNKNEDGIVEFSDGRLITVAFDTVYDKWEKGEAKVTLTDSIEDPWAELEVIEVLGAGYCRNSIDLSKSTKLTDVNLDEVLPYILNARFDKGVMNKGEQVFF